MEYRVQHSLHKWIAISFLTMGSSLPYDKWVKCNFQSLGSIISLLRHKNFVHYAPINISPQRGGDTLGIRQQNNPTPRGLDRTPKDMGWVIRYFSRSSKLIYITNLMAHPRDFGHKVFANGWRISQHFFSKLSNCPWESRHTPTPVLGG